MANVKVEVQDAVVDGKGKGAELVLDAASAKHLEAIGYVKVIKNEGTKSAGNKTSTKPVSKTKPKTAAKSSETSDK